MRHGECLVNVLARGFAVVFVTHGNLAAQLLDGEAQRDCRILAEPPGITQRELEIAQVGLRRSAAGIGGRQHSSQKSAGFLLGTAPSVRLQPEIAGDEIRPGTGAGIPAQQKQRLVAGTHVEVPLQIQAAVAGLRRAADLVIPVQVARRQLRGVHGAG